MKNQMPVTVDFEGEEIQLRPHYPPRPTSVSILIPGQQPEFLAWGHPVGNNCTKDFAQRRLARIWKGGDRILFHHGKFDQDVADRHFKLPILPADRYEDSLFLAFLHDPHSPSLELKVLAERHLNMKPKERDELRDWIIANVPGATKGSWGAHISKAPAHIVGKYAKGDTARTLPLWKKLHADIVKRNMAEAYMRERKLMPILLETERSGIRVNLNRLRRDALFYGGKLSARMTMGMTSTKAE
jgi:DNA polymerase I-like protein with 3'-5' exonuclease and polymerase domains